MNTKIDESEDNTFGRCPECGGNDGFLNIGRNHVFMCNKHKLAWIVGSNWFRCWRNETEEDWKKNKAILSEYRKVDGYSDD